MCSYRLGRSPAGNWGARPYLTREARSAGAVYDTTRPTRAQPSADSESIAHLEQSPGLSSATPRSRQDRHIARPQVRQSEPPSRLDGRLVPQPAHGAEGGPVAPRMPTASGVMASSSARSSYNAAVGSARGCGRFGWVGPALNRAAAGWSRSGAACGSSLLSVAEHPAATSRASISIESSVSRTSRKSAGSEGSSGRDPPRSPSSCAARSASSHQSGGVRGGRSGSGAGEAMGCRTGRADCVGRFVVWG